MKNPSSKMTKVKKREIIKGYLNSLKPLFNQSGDTLTLTIMENDNVVSTMVFSVHILKGVMKPITQRVIQLKDVDTLKMIESISHLVPLGEKDMKLVREQILTYSRDLVNEYYG